MFLRSALMASVLVACCAASASPAAQAPRRVDAIAGPDGGWDFATVDAATGRVFLSRTAGVTVFDPKARTATHILPELIKTHQAVPINGGKEVLVTVGSTGEAVIADIATGAVRARVKTGAKPDAAMLEPVSGLIWVMDNHGGGITLINPVSGLSEGQIPAEGALETAVSDGAGKVYINVEDLNSVITVDVAARKLVRQTKLPGCDGPTGLGFDTDHGLLVSACANGVAVISRADTGEITGSVKIAANPDVAVYDAARKLVYIPTGKDGQVAMIDAAKAHVVGSFAAKTGSRAIVLDPSRGLIFIPSAEFSPPATAGGRPVAKPGSFELLVYRSH
jgi:DNA-binding beta-propeller fold protein YncE